MEQRGSENGAQVPLPCANDCGFFGSPATRNLCSKCFRDSLRRAEAAHQAVATASATAVASARSSSSAAAPVDHEVVATAAATEGKGRSGRCAACGRKVGLMGFECRCGGVFCGAHRYSDRHDCGFDYRGAGRDAIARANPVVRADKQIDKL